MFILDTLHLAYWYWLYWTHFAGRTGSGYAGHTSPGILAVVILDTVHCINDVMLNIAPHTHVICLPLSCVFDNLVRAATDLRTPQPAKFNAKNNANF